MTNEDYYLGSLAPKWSDRAHIVEALREHLQDASGALDTDLEEKELADLALITEAYRRSQVSEDMMEKRKAKFKEYADSPSLAEKLEEIDISKMAYFKKEAGLKSKLLKKLFGFGAIQNVANTAAAGLTGILGTGYGLNKINEMNEGRHRSNSAGPEWLRNLARWWKYEAPSWFPWTGNPTEDWSPGDWITEDGVKRQFLGRTDAGRYIFNDTPVFGKSNPDNYFDFPELGGGAGDPDILPSPLDLAELPWEGFQKPSDTVELSSDDPLGGYVPIRDRITEAHDDGLSDYDPARADEYQ